MDYTRLRKREKEKRGPVKEKSLTRDNLDSTAVQFIGNGFASHGQLGLHTTTQVWNGRSN